MTLVLAVWLPFCTPMERLRCNESDRGGKVDLSAEADTVVVIAGATVVVWGVKGVKTDPPRTVDVVAVDALDNLGRWADLGAGVLISIVSEGNVPRGGGTDKGAFAVCLDTSRWMRC